MANVLLDKQIVKSGYLIKSARGTLTGWKKRYFVLNGSTITYFADHNNLTKAKGDLLLTQDSSVEDISLSGKAFCVRITTPFSNLVIATKDEGERTSWKNAIESSINRCRTSLRSYITKKGGLIEGKVRRFFILDDGIITYHKDHEHTGQILGVFRVGPQSKMTYSDTDLSIDLVQGDDTASLLEMKFLQATEEYNLWKTVLLTLVSEHIGEAKVETVADEPLVVLKKGKLKMRPVKGGEVWDDFNFTLTPSAMIALDEITGTQTIETFHINPSCSVFETNLGRNAFELVTPKRVLHVMADSREATSAWIKVLRETISNSDLEINDPLLIAAIEKMKVDVLYQVSFHEDKPLGVVLERSGEWAIVKLANERDTGVIVGSALMAVNKDDVMFAKYQETIGRLKNWRPPLTLSFLKSPEKRGYLVKESRGRHGNTRNWKRRYFVIEQGRIYYKDKDTPDSEIKGDIPLMGSAVSLASSQETGKFFCFRLVSGVTCLVMQAETFDELMDWASTLYHAIGIANGGAHILRVEYEKRTAKPVTTAPLASSAAQVEADALADSTVNDMIAKAKLLAEKSTPVEEARAAVEPPEPPVNETVVEDPVPAVVDVVPEAEPEVLLVDQAAERRLAAETGLREATETACLSNLSSLISALDEAKDAGVDEAMILVSESKLSVLQKEKEDQVVLCEINNSLINAIAVKSISALLSALETAESRAVSNENTEAAKIILTELQAEEGKRAAEEKKRLETEAAALDAELAAEEATAIAAGGKPAGGMQRLESAYSDDDYEELDV